MFGPCLGVHMLMNKTSTRISRLALSHFPFMQALSAKTYLTGILRDRTIFPFRYLDKIGVSLFRSIRTGSGIRLTSCSMGTGVLSRELKQQRHAADHSPKLVHVQVQIHISKHIHGDKKYICSSPRHEGAEVQLHSLATSALDEWST